MTERAQRKVEALRELQQSRGWALVCEHVRAHIERTYGKFAADPKMGMDEVHYVRGVIANLHETLRLPDNLVMLYENEARLEKVDEA